MPRMNWFDEHTKHTVIDEQVAQYEVILLLRETG